MNARPSAFIGLSFILAALLLGLAACSSRSPAPGAPVDINVEIKEYSVNMSRLVLPANTPLRFVITNHGVITHQIMLEKADGLNLPYRMDGRDETADAIDPGQTQTVLWVVDKPGEYQLSCHIPGHYEGGMVQLFAVDPPGLPGLIALAPSWFLFGVMGMALVVILSLAGLNRWRPFPIQPGETR